jgi:hypothetical protein
MTSICFDNPSLHYDKTDKGREEIASRKNRLTPQLRTVLLLIDGKNSVEKLIQRYSFLGLTEETLTELSGAGYINAAAPVAVAVATPDEAPAAPAPEVSAVPDMRSQFIAVYQFYTETIKSMIGLRGCLLQLKVEKAGTIDELRAMRNPYLEAVLKAKGEQVAKSLRYRLDELLNSW